MGNAARVASIAVSALLAAVWCPSAFALNAALDVSQYVHTSWKYSSGFTLGTIKALAQTPDGYLWLGTDVGLVRFDGVRAMPWQPPPDQPLPSNVIVGLLVSRDGRLWIGTDGGLASWKDGQLSRHEALAGAYVSKLVEDRDGTIWITRFVNGWTLCSVQKTSVTCHGEDGGPGANTFSLLQDGTGNLWVGTATGVWRWKPGTPTFIAIPGEDNGIQGLAEDADGSLLISKRGGVWRVVDGRVEMAHKFPPPVQMAEALRLRRDRGGALWVGTTIRGLVHFHDGAVDVFSRTDGLSGDYIHAVYEDREGTIWVATDAGLDRFREPAIVSYSARQGLSATGVNSVLTTADGSVWVGTYDGATRWKNGPMSILRERAAPRPTGVHSMFEDSQHRLWMSSLHGVSYLQNDRLVRLAGLPGGATRAIVEDADGTVWFANPGAGLFRLPRGSSEVEHNSWAALKHQDVSSAVAVDPSGRGLWIGFFRGGISYFKDGAVAVSFDASAGLAGGRVSALHADAAGALWIATDRGLSRLKSGRITTLTSANGLPCDAAGWAIQDAAGSLWVGMACGLARIARGEIDAWIAAGESGASDLPHVNATLFDHLDGVRTFVTASYYTAPVARAADGKLWFTSQEGVSVVDPARLPGNPLLPPVHIEGIIADRKIYRADARSDGIVQLPVLTRDLQIDYTALSLVEPGKMRFRYRLEGRDTEWQDVGTRRQAYYSDLPPAQYRFRVIASNNDGVWNEAGAAVDFEIAPAYYQTTWFMVLVAGMLLTLAWAAHRLRLRIVEAHEREITALNEKLMSAQEQERIRIAGELHDGVMQEMLAATMMLGTAKRRFGGNAEAQAAIDKVQQKLVHAGTEIRQLSHDLHPPALQEAGLPDALRSHCEQFSSGCGIPIVCDADDRAHELSRGAALALFRIVQEALGNAAKHGQATRITVSLARSGDDVTLTVSDNGVGFDRTRLTTSGGLGLITMRERAGQLNGRFEFTTTPGRGTTITVVIPFR